MYMIDFILICTSKIEKTCVSNVVWETNKIIWNLKHSNSASRFTLYCNSLLIRIQQISALFGEFRQISANFGKFRHISAYFGAFRRFSAGRFTVKFPLIDWLIYWLTDWLIKCLQGRRTRNTPQRFGGEKKKWRKKKNRFMGDYTCYYSFYNLLSFM